MAEESQQISVAELLKRNGQTVESRGGRRRRGVTGGISVAELTGEIPIVRPGSSRAAAESDSTEPESVESEVVEATATSTPAESASAVEAPDTAASGTEVEAAPKAETAAAAADPAAPEVETGEPPQTAAFAVTFDDEDDESVDEKPAEAVESVDNKPAYQKPDLHKPVSKDKPGKWVSRAAVPSVGPAKVTQEPALLSGQTLAGDLMRQERAVAQNTQNQSMRGPILPPRVAPVAAGDNDSTELIDKINVGTAEPAAANVSMVKEPADNLSVPEAVVGASAEADDESANRSSIREWAILGGQVIAALIIGGAMFKGFEKLWDVLPWVALVLALIVIVGLVAVVRVLRKTDDITSFVIAVVVGMIVTLGPLAFLLASG